MHDIAIKRLSELEPYRGPHAIEGIRFRAAARQLGVEAWGMNVLELDPGCTGHPEHDHESDGQEEVYFVVQGTATLQTGSETRELASHDFARVGPSVTRKIVAGPQGVTILAIGGTPGRPYEPSLPG